MNIENIYPHREKSTQRRAKFMRVMRWTFAGAAYCCPILNFLLGGPPWCLVALWSLWLIWTNLLSPSLVENNRISRASRLLIDSCVLLILIDSVWQSGWAPFVIPIVSFGSLVIIGVLFLSDFKRQKQNMMPMVWLIIAALVALIASLAGWPEFNWPMKVLGATALALLLICTALLRRGLLKELRKRFHIR